ncbi:MAG: phospholipase [Bacteroidales bacterium]|nr:phospholipase [Bacteroidales bacterium]
MIAALYILLVIIAVGIVARLLDRKVPDGPADATDTAGAAVQEPADQADEECCGMHITCERDSLLAAVSDRIEYYDDEELDAYAGRGADDYTDDEIDRFRDVLLTLLPDDIAGWARSVQLRGITLPSAVRDELLLIVGEERARRHA